MNTEKLKRMRQEFLSVRILDLRKEDSNHVYRGKEIDVNVLKTTKNKAPVRRGGCREYSIDPEKYPRSVILLKPP